MIQSSPGGRSEPDGTGRVRTGRIVHLWLTLSSTYPEYSIQYLLGSPQRVRQHGTDEDIGKVLSTMRNDEWLVTDRAVTQGELERIVTVGKYQVFRAKGQAGP